jgi:hypothetical protein
MRWLIQTRLGTISARQVGIDPDAHKEAIEKMSVFLRG